MTSLAVDKVNLGILSVTSFVRDRRKIVFVTFNPNCFTMSTLNVFSMSFCL